MESTLSPRNVPNEPSPAARWPKPGMFVAHRPAPRTIRQHPWRFVRGWIRPARLLAWEPYSHTYYKVAAEKEEALLNAPAAGTVIGLDVVARMHGGMGEILVVRETEKGVPKLSVLKTILSSRLGSPANVERFIREATLMIGLDAWPTVDLQDIRKEGLFTSRVFLKLNYCTGGSLADRMKSMGMTYPEAIHHLLCVTMALADLHRDGFVHADLKLENILIGRDPGSYEANPALVTLLADFGLTSKYREAPSSGRVGGTPSYSSPEQLLGGPPTAPMDVWSWGVVAYQLLTGRHPYLHLLESMDVLTTAMREPREINIDFTRPGLTECPDWLLSTIRSCLQKDPAKRPAMRAILEAFRDGVRLCNEFGSEFTFCGRLAPDATPVMISSHLVSTLRERWNWPRSGNITTARISIGPMATIQRAERLLKLDTAFTANEARNELDRLLGKWDDPHSILGMHKADPDRKGYPVPTYFKKPGVFLAVTELQNAFIPICLRLKCQALHVLVDLQADDEDIKDYYATVKGWDEVGVYFPVDYASQLVLVAYGMAVGGDLQRAEGYGAAALKAMPDNPAILRIAGQILRARRKFPEAKHFSFRFMKTLVGEVDRHKDDAGRGDAQELTRSADQMLMAIMENGDYAEVINTVRKSNRRELLKDACVAICQHHLSGRVDPELLHPLRHFQEEVEKIPLDIREMRYLAEAVLIAGHKELARSLAEYALGWSQMKLPWFSIYRPDLGNLAAGKPCEGAPPSEPTDASS